MFLERVILSRPALFFEQATGLALLVGNTLFLVVGMYAMSEHLVAFLAAVLRPAG